MFLSLNSIINYFLGTGCNSGYNFGNVVLCDTYEENTLFPCTSNLVDPIFA